jgi:hypothetical protein
VVGFAVAGGLWVWWVQDNRVFAWPWLAPVGTLTTTIVALIANAVGTPNVAGPLANRGPQSGLHEPR